jgi:hypothetical protein
MARTAVTRSLCVSATFQAAGNTSLRQASAFDLVQVEFEARRSAGTLPGLFLATPYDLHSSRW